MERFFDENNSDQSLRKDLIFYILSFLHITDILQLFRVNLKIRKITSKLKKVQTFIRLRGRLKEIKFQILFEHKSKMILHFLTEEMNYQESIIGKKFSEDDWEELQEVMVFLVSVKLKTEDKEDIEFDANQRTFFYVKEALNLLPRKELKIKKLKLNPKKISKHISKKVSHLLLIGKLREIDFSRCKFSRIGFNNFLSTFNNSNFDNRNNPLEKLILYRCELGDSAIKELMIVIKNKLAITHLDLVYNKLENQPFCVLAENSSQYNLKSLKLDFNEISKKGVKNLCKYLISNSHLKKLSIINALLNEKSFDYISMALKKLNLSINSTNKWENQGLNQLTLGLNNLKSNSVKNFIHSLKLNTTMTNLKIFLSEFCEKGNILFINYLALPVCIIKVLDFCTFNFNDNFMIYSKLIESLKINKSIEVLKFTSCDMDHSYLHSIFEVIEANKKIKILDIRGNLFTQNDVQNFTLSNPRELKILI